MSQTAYILAGVTFYIISIIILIIVLNIISNKEKKRYRTEITMLEREKNLIISSSMLSELNKVDALVNNSKLQEKVDEWKERFSDIRNNDVAKITEKLIEIEDLFNDKEYKELDEKLAKANSLVVGVYVVRVDEFSAAEKAGINIGDVITGIDGKKITSMDELNEIKNTHKINDEVKLTIYRNGAEKEITVKLQEQ